MLDIKKAIKDSEELKETLREYKDQLMVEIKKGNRGLYKKYIEVCGDYLKLTSQLEKLYKVC